MMLEISYFLLVLALLLLFLLGVKRVCQKMGQSPQKQSKTVALAAMGLLAWLGWVSGVAASGLLQTTTLPPRIPLFLIIPAFLFIAIFVRGKRSQKFIRHIPEAWLVGMQSFRIVVELLFYYTFLAGIFPELVTFEGRNFDIVAGLTAPLMVLLFYYFKVLPKKLILVWHIASLFILANIVFIGMTLAYVPSFWGMKVGVMSDFVSLPFVYIAGFFMPSAVFLHAVAIQKLFQKEESLS